MKKYFPYILGAVGLAALTVLLLTNAKKPQRKMDQRVTLKQNDKIPYGFYVARQLLPSMFPGSQVYNDSEAPGYWDSISFEDPNQAAFVIAKNFNPSEYEMEQLVEFAKAGNHVFVISKYLSYDAKEYFNCTDAENYFDNTVDANNLSVTLSHPPFGKAQTYLYPGKKERSYFSTFDTLRTIVLGRNSDSTANFIQMKAGKGNVYIHVTPLVFSNYFILHKNNIRHYEKVLSVIPPGVQKIVWSEYYLSKRSLGNEDDKQGGWLSIFLQYRPFRWGLATAVCILVLYVLLEMRRKQRIIPVLQRPANDSLDFVKTIGRLYYDKKDHRNLAKKMAVYFADHVRNQYKIALGQFDDTFVKALNAKTGYGIIEIQQIAGFINYIETVPAISEKQLSDFYNQLELFYQKN